MKQQFLIKINLSSSPKVIYVKIFDKVNSIDVSLDFKSKINNIFNQSQNCLNIFEEESRKQDSYNYQLEYNNDFIKLDRKSVV